MLMGRIATAVREFYAARAAGDMAAVAQFIREDVVWREPGVGTHMGEVRGVGAVLDMIQRARETPSACAAHGAWTAQRDGVPIAGSEPAVFRFDGGQIAEASFFAGNLEHDRRFWGEWHNS
jgi:ketosteroid isomerase-like protein